MKFRSTRGNSEELRAAQAIIRGIAPDRGLYVPEEIPEMPDDIKAIWSGDDPAGMISNATYQDIAKKIIGAFFTDCTEEEIGACVDGAYDSKFDTEEIAPLVQAGDAWFLELYHGKTAAFKDMALSILPRLLTTAVKKEQDDSKICILTATSGDTGKAALEGFADVPGTEITVFYPDSGVSEVQERQMVTQTGGNTHVFAVKGNFDDAQTGVKNAFQNEAFAAELGKKGIKLSSANSINIGRLIPQCVYYVWSYISMIRKGAVKPGEKININKERFVIGRERGRVDYCISDNTAVGRTHAIIVNRGGSAYVIDQNSRNCTYVNDQRAGANQEVKIKSGDKITFADEAFTYNAR